MALRVVVVAGALACGACGVEDAPAAEPPPIVWEGEWLSFGRSDQVEPQCGGVAPYMDRYVGELIDIFGVDPDIAVAFYYVDDASTPCDSIACVKEHAVFSRDPIQEHELVHAVRSFEGFSHLLLEEGAAEYWGDDSKAFPFRQQTGGSIVGAAETASEGFATEAYGVAGRFHAFVVREAKLDATNALLRSTTEHMGTQALDEQLERVTGLGLQEWEAAFEGYPVCDHAEFRDASAACRSVPLVPRCVDGMVASIEVHVGCDDELALGPRDGEIWTYRAIDIPESGTYVLSILPDLEMKGGSVELKQCAGGCGSVVESRDVPQSATPGREFDAEAGTYLIRFTLPVGESGDFSVRVAGACP